MQALIANTLGKATFPAVRLAIESLRHEFGAQDVIGLLPASLNAIGFCLDNGLISNKRADELCGLIECADYSALRLNLTQKTAELQ